MAWLQNLAGRAEDLLNKVDQHAATVLNESNSLEDQTDLSSTLINLEPPIEPVVTTIDETVRLKPAEMGEPAEMEPLREVGDVPDSVFKRESSERSISSHNSFILSEEMQLVSEKASKLEAENYELNKQILNLQHLFALLRNENSNLVTQVTTANEMVSTAQTEMEQYKARTQRILQEKEHLIAIKHDSSSDEDSTAIYIKYNAELKKELEFQQGKNEELIEKVKKLTSEVGYFQQQLLNAQNSHQQSISLYEENLKREKNMCRIAEEECQLQAAELHAKLNELNQLSQVVRSKNDEILNLKNVIRDKSMSGPNEAQVKSLTDILMVKQTNLENVTTERNALKLQMEKLESEYQQKQAQWQKAQVRINVNDTDDVKSQVPQFMKMSPRDAGVTRRVKHAYSTVDSISIRTGHFLRRYPIARVCVFCYMVLLQLWALLVLFIYAPSTR